MTFRPGAGLPSIRKRNFAASPATSSSGCVTGANSKPLPVVASTVVVGAPAVRNTSLRDDVSVSFTLVALAGISATVSGAGWPGRGGPPRPPTRFSTPSTVKLPITPDICVPTFHVPGLSSWTSNTDR